MTSREWQNLQASLEDYLEHINSRNLQMQGIRLEHFEFKSKRRPDVTAKNTLLAYYPSPSSITSDRDGRPSPTFRKDLPERSFFECDLENEPEPPFPGDGCDFEMSSR